ncbi:glycosyl hydrolase family 17 protein [Tenacibaculum tangerinum]|uniref:Endo-1,3-beta-glucanase btgC n=1 Tax=Tenacibaculum tangerinum TaxID=3038772 RepID=A0ABY8L4P3_9FLAO|nr:glycosyl hydrolase family 17 protein [Tenacibaculum tangerinum]WGH76051.1 glycosyl hydrolase family 17 protein [Tenacibaculum tangerinum]
MSKRKEKFLALAELDFTDKSVKGLQKTFRDFLQLGIHGLCFSPYIEGQKPGDKLTEKQIRHRIEVIKPYTRWIRSFSCTEGNELIPKIAKEYGLKTLVGAWLGDDKKKNKEEIDGLLDLYKNNLIDVAAVGNEVMYRGDLTEDELLQYIYDVKKVITDVPVGYVDAYYEFVDRPKITEACDVILANCYPFWEGCDQDYSLLYIKDMYRRAKEAGNGKEVIVTETGWPTQGSNLYGAYPSYENALKYFINIQRWSKEEDIKMFYFSSFDESWKVSSEGDVGAYWGIWDKNEKLKF